MAPPLNGRILRSLLAYYGYLCLRVRFVSAGASPNIVLPQRNSENLRLVDHGKALTDWLQSYQGGYLHPRVEIRREGSDDSPFFGMYATGPIPEGELLLQVPEQMLFPRGDLRLGDRVIILVEEKPYTGSLVKESKEGHFHIQMDNEQEYTDVPKSRIYHEWKRYGLCGTVDLMLKEIALGDKSEYAPFLNYLRSQPTGQLPTAWSSAAKEILIKILGQNARGSPILPPAEPLSHLEDFYTDCTKRGPMVEHLYLLVTQRGWDETLIPIYDMMNHGNGRLLNTVSNSVHGHESVRVHASRDITPGEQIHGSYNFCEDCDARVLHYGTPEILRDYGFVENYPQRWVFYRQQVIFDIDYIQNPDGSLSDKLKVEWVQGHNLDADDVDFFEEQLERLEDLRQTILANKHSDVTDHEWFVLTTYHNALVVAIRAALQTAAQSEGGSCDDESCVIGAPLLVELAEDVDHDADWDVKPVTCDIQAWKKQPKKSLNALHSPYQTIQYFESMRNETQEADICYSIDEMKPMCSSYRPHYHEMAVHWTARFLLELKFVLLVGGGNSMLLHEVLKYPSLQKVVVLELDQIVTRGAFRYFGTQPHFNDERVEWWYGDAAKTALLLPKEYFGSFDLVLLDVLHEVASMEVTDGLDIFTVASLLVKGDGILVGNDYPYFRRLKSVFNHVVHIHYYDIPVVCSQSIMVASNGVDFLRGDCRDHGVHHIFNLLDDPNVRYNVIRDYQKNSTAPRCACPVGSGLFQDEGSLVRGSSSGVTMVLEVENATVELSSLDALKNLIDNTLRSEGFTVLSSSASSANAKVAATIAVLGEGYVVTRVWPDFHYCAFDIHLWSSIEKQGHAKRAVMKAMKTNNSDSSFLYSSYRMVTGGMSGVDTANVIPTLCPCSNLLASEKSNVAEDTVGDAAVSLAIEEAMSMIHDENNFLVVVICGARNEDCAATEALLQSRKVGEVIPVHTCADLASANEFSEHVADRIQSCEKVTREYLEAVMESKQKKIRAMVIDTGATRIFVSIFHSLCKNPDVASRLFADNLLVAAPSLQADHSWRRVFVDSFRKTILPFEPSFTANVRFKRNDEEGGLLLFPLYSKGDHKFPQHLIDFVVAVEQKGKFVGEMEAVRAGDYGFQDPLESKQRFTDGDFNQEDSLKQWNAQKQLGLQTWFQLEARKSPLRLDPRTISESLAVVLEECAQDQTSFSIQDAIQVGDGAVVPVFWAEGTLVVQWDGRDKLDINIFSYEENFDFPLKFVRILLNELIVFKKVFHDAWPRGMGSVVLFAKDIAADKNPRWYSSRD